MTWSSNMWTIIRGRSVQHPRGGFDIIKTFLRNSISRVEIGRGISLAYIGIITKYYKMNIAHLDGYVQINMWREKIGENHVRTLQTFQNGNLNPISCQSPTIKPSWFSVSDFPWIKDSWLSSPTITPSSWFSVLSRTKLLDKGEKGSTNRTLYI